MWSNNTKKNVDLATPVDDCTAATSDDATVSTLNAATSNIHGNTKNANYHSWDDENMKNVQKFWCLNEKRMSKVYEMRHMTEDIDHWKNSPHTCVQFLKEHKWDVKVSAKYFRNMIKWRKENNVENIMNEYAPPKDFEKLFPVTVLEGLDNDGDTIHIECLGASKPWILLDKYGPEGVKQWSNYLREHDTNHVHAEWIQEYEKKYNKPMIQFGTAIFDFEGLSTKHLKPAFLNLLVEVALIILGNYPSVAKRIIAIRTPFIFRVVWNCLKPVLSENIKETIIFAPNDYLATLNQYMDLQVLPECIYPKGEGQPNYKYGAPTQRVAAKLQQAPPKPTAVTTSDSSQITQQESYCSSIEFENGGDDNNTFQNTDHCRQYESPGVRTSVTIIANGQFTCNSDGSINSIEVSGSKSAISV